VTVGVAAASWAVLFTALAVAAFNVLSVREPAPVL